MNGTSLPVSLYLGEAMDKTTDSNYRGRRSNITDAGGHWPGDHDFYLAWIRGDTSLRYHMSQKRDGLLELLTLRRFQYQSSASQALEDRPETIEVLVDSGCKNDDVVQVHQADLEIKSGLDQIHQPLESRRCTCKAEWHYSELKSAFTGDKRGLLCATRIHFHLVVSGPEVKCRKPTRSSHGVQTGVDSG